MKVIINKSIYLTIIGLFFLPLILGLSSCKKIVEVDPPYTSINAANVFNSNSTAIAALTGIYSKMSYNSFVNGGITSMSFLPALSSDELTLYNGVSNVSLVQYYKNSLLSTSSINLWITIYPIIYASNSAIEGLNGGNDLTISIKQQLLGEAKFIRAFCYFYLVNLYGDVPLATNSDWKVNSLLHRNSKAEVYEQIITDLKDAQSLLSESYLDATLQPYSTTPERIRPTKWAATALLARVYLYTADYAKAEEQSSSIINNNSLFSLASLNNVFKKNSNEAIWQLQPVFIGYNNTEDARIFILPSSGPSDPVYPVFLNNALVSSFENNDERKINWIGKYTDTTPNPDKDYYYPFKYKVSSTTAPSTEYTMVLRIGEQFLIRAEARANLNKLDEAKVDLNSIRTRSGLPNTTEIDKSSLLKAIHHERQVELFTEWGHRWLDLIRTGNVDGLMNVITSAKGGGWQETDKLYPIPLSEIQRDPNLLQNAGY